MAYTPEYTVLKLGFNFYKYVFFLDVHTVFYKPILKCNIRMRKKKSCKIITSNYIFFILIFTLDNLNELSVNILGLNLQFLLDITKTSKVQSLINTTKVNINTKLNQNRFLYT